MTQDEIIHVARKAGLPTLTEYGYESLERFAALVAANEREACAKVCDQYAENSSNPMNFAENCAAAIRERGEPK